MQKKEAESKNPFLRPARVFFLGVISLSLCVYYFHNLLGVDRFVSKMQWLHVKDVVIQAQWPLTAARIHNWIPHLEGSSILLVDASLLMKNLEKRPWVKSVSVKKQYPDRILISVDTVTARAIALWRGKTYFMDGEGHLIERVEPSVNLGHDLPVIAWEGQEDDSRWKIGEVFELLQSVKSTLGKSMDVSEVNLRSYPNVRLFLSSTRLEILFNIENWTAQISRLALLVQNPPPEVGTIHRINLTIPKKAVVSASLSN